MESYVKFFIDFLDEGGYEYEFGDDEDSVELYLSYENEDDEVTVKINLLPDFVLFKALADDDADFSLEALEYANELNSHVAEYRFFIGKEGGMFIERIKAIERYHSDYVITGTILSEVIRLCEACVKIRNA